MFSLKRLCLILCFIFWVLPATAQNIIKGTVKDAGTGKPLPAVDVYLSNTTIGAYTNNRGRYVIKTNSSGIFKLVYSFVGYKKKVFKINLKSNVSQYTLDVSLKTKTQKLKNVVVSGSNKEWQKNYARFKNAFLGKTEFANKTTIQNPFVLEFSNAHGKLLAKAGKPLVVINRALGYKIFVDLDQFKWAGPSLGFYTVYPRFEKLTAQNEQQRLRWKQNRKETYRRSLQYFLKSLYNNHIRNNHFSISKPSYLVALDKKETKFYLMGNQHVSKKLAKILKGFKLNRKITVVQGRTSSYATYSILIPNRENRIFYVDNKGNLLNPLSLKISGYWANLRFANKLPLNYTGH